MSVEDRIHQDFTRRRRFVRDFLLQKLAYTLLMKVTVKGLNHIPAEGPAIMMYNHITGIDPIMVAGTCTPRFIEIMSKIENFTRPHARLILELWGGGYAIKRGEVDREALNFTLKLLEAGKIPLISPEGTRSPALQKGKHGIAYLAAKARVPIIPVAVYDLETWLRDIFLPRRTHPTVSFGRPFLLKTGGRQRVPRQELQVMTEEIMYQLAALLPERNRGVYYDLSKITTETLEFL